MNEDLTRPDPTRPLSPEDAPTLAEAAFVGDPGVVPDHRLIRLLGEGGMGQVWEAEQERPVRRTVAVKLIKWGMDTGQFLARFASERQALALMSHPNIARVFDAGATDRGRPYFAMEYAPGPPLTAYCDERRLATEERLRLFQQVCEAVQHAHQKGVMHRDLKPTNVLVTEVGGKAAPKIIDFGLAKATEQRLTEQTLYTRLGQIVGTPEYMSPEQVDLDEPDVDTRTDVYSLGVILYELLTGSLPLPSEELRRGGFAELQRRLREQEPAWPSSRVRAAGEAGEEAAGRRGADLRGLGRRLRGDLDWIVMKALAKDRSRRYGSPAELAADIERHLRHEPVLAGPPGRGYRARKFLRRHRAAATAAGVVVGVLVAGVVGTATGLVEAQRAEAAAREEAQAAETVSGFLVELFEVVDPGEARGNTVTAREILDRGAGKIERQLAGEPLMQARMMTLMGKVYSELGLYGQARPLLEKALAIRERELGPDTLPVAETLEHLSQVLFLGFDELLTTAKEMSERVLAIRRAELAPDHPDLAQALVLRAGWFHLQFAEHHLAEPLLQEALAIYEQAGDAEAKGYADALHHMGILYSQLYEYERGEGFYRRAIELQESIDDPRVWDSYMRIGELRLWEQRWEEAEEALQHAAAIVEAEIGADYPLLRRVHTDLGHAAIGMGDYEEAAARYARSMEIAERAGQADWLARWDVGRALAYQGDLDGAAGFFEPVLPLLEPEGAMYQYWLACYHALHGRTEEALHYLRRSVALGMLNDILVAAKGGFLTGDPDFAALQEHPVMRELRESFALSYQACEQVKRGAPEQAVRTLGESLDRLVAVVPEAAAVAVARLASHPDCYAFGSLRGMPEHAALVARMEARVAAGGVLPEYRAKKLLSAARSQVQSGDAAAALESLSEGLRVMSSVNPRRAAQILQFWTEDAMAAPLRELPGFQALAAEIGAGGQE